MCKANEVIGNTLNDTKFAAYVGNFKLEFFLLHPITKVHNLLITIGHCKFLSEAESILVISMVRSLH